MVFGDKTVLPITYKRLEAAKDRQGQAHRKGCIDVDCLKSAIDRYGIDESGSGYVPWIPSTSYSNDNCRSYYDYFLLELANTTPNNSYFLKDPSYLSSYAWKLSLWRDSSSRLSSDLVVPFSDYFSSRNNKLLYALELPSVVDCASWDVDRGMVHLVVELIHEMTAVPISHHTIHLQLDIFDRNDDDNGTPASAPIDAQFSSTKSRMDDAAGTTRKNDEYYLKKYPALGNKDAVVLKLGTCNSVSFQPQPFSSFANLLPARDFNFIYPSFSAIVSVQPTHAKICHWQLHTSYAVRPFPTYVPTPSEVLLHLINEQKRQKELSPELNTNLSNYIADIETTYTDMALDRRVYATVLDLQLVPDLIEMCKTGNIIVIAQGYSDADDSHAPVYSDIDNPLGDRATYLGGISKAHGDWLSQAEMRVLHSGNRIQRIKFSVNFLSAEKQWETNSKNGGNTINLKQVTLCEGMLDNSAIQLEMSEEGYASGDFVSKNKWNGLGNGCYEMMLTVEQDKYDDRMELNLGKIVVKIDIVGDGLDAPFVVSQKLENKYNEVVAAFMSSEPLPKWIVPLPVSEGMDGEEELDYLAVDDDLRGVDCTLLGIVDTLACLASCSVRVASVRGGQKEAWTGENKGDSPPEHDEVLIYDAMQHLIARLADHSLCDKNTMTILSTILMEDSLYATKISLSLWLRHWIFRVAPTSVLGFMAATEEIPVESLSDEPLEYLLTPSDWSAIRCACSCLLLLRLSKPLDDTVERRLDAFEEFEILQDFMINNSAIDNISTHLVEKLIVYGMQATTVAASEHKSPAQLQHYSRPNAFDPYALHMYVDHLVMNVVECSSFLLESLPHMTLDFVMNLNGFVNAVMTASHMVMADAADLTSAVGDAQTATVVVAPVLKAYDKTPNQRNACLLSFLTAVLRTLPQGFSTLYSAPIAQWAQTFAGRNLQSLPVEDAHAAAICEYLSSSVISLNKFIMASSIQTDAHFDSFQLLRNYLLVQTSLSSTMSLLSRDLMCMLKVFDGNIDSLSRPGELSGEASLAYMMDRAPLFEAYLSCSKVTLAYMSKSINSGVAEDDNITFLFHPRLVLQRMLSTVMKGRESDGTIVSIVLRSLSYQPEYSYHVSMFLSHAVASICHYWIGLEQLQRISDLNRLGQGQNSCYMDSLRLSFTFAKADLLHLLRSDFVLFREAASVLFVRGTTDPLFSTSSVVSYMDKKKRKQIRRKSSHKEYYLLDMITVEEALEDGPIAQWVRLWQQLLMSISDFIKSIAYIGVCDPIYLSAQEIDFNEEHLTLQHFIELLCEVCILSPLLDSTHERSNHYHAGHETTIRPDLVLLCVDDEEHGAVVLKALLSTAATLPVSDDYERGREALIGCCIDLMKLLADTPDAPLALQGPFLRIVDEIVLSTLPDMVPYDGVEVPLYIVCPAIFHILGHSASPAMSLSHSLLMDDHYFSKSGFARTMRCLYTLFFRRGYEERVDNQLRADDAGSDTAEQLIKFSELITRKLSALRLYVLGKFSCIEEYSDIDISDGRSIEGITDSDICERLYSRFSNLVTAAALQTFLPSSQKFVASEVAFDTIASIMGELGSLHLYNTGHHSQERLYLRLLRPLAEGLANDLTLGEREALERRLNFVSEWTVDPVKSLGYAHVGTAELLKIFVHDHFESLAPSLNVTQFERGHHYVRQGTHELVSSGDWSLAFHLVDARIDKYKESLSYIRPRLPAHNRYVALISELERTKEKIVELGVHDSAHRPHPTFYAIKFSVSPWDVAEVVEGLDLREFYAATCCTPLPARDEDAYEDTDSHFYSGTWLVLRCDPTASVAAAALYNELIYGEVRAKDRGEVLREADRMPIFLPPQCYVNMEDSLRKAFPSFELVSPDSHYDTSKSGDYKVIQIFQAFPPIDDDWTPDEMWEHVMHSKRFYVFTNESEGVTDGSSDGSVLRYTLSTERCDDEWYSKRGKPSHEHISVGQMDHMFDLEAEDEAAEGDGAFALFAASHWAAPASVAFVSDTAIYSTTDALMMVLHYQTIFCTPLGGALASMADMTSAELKLQPPAEVYSRMCIVTATVTVLSNIMSFPNGVCAGYHNSSQIIGAETERRELAWQELRKGIKQMFIKTKAAYDERLQELFEKLGNVSEAELRTKPGHSDLRAEVEQMIHEAPEEPDYVELEAELHRESLPLSLIQDHHSETIVVVEGLARSLRRCVHKMCAQNLADGERARDGDGDDIASSRRAPHWSTSHKINQKIDEDNIVWLQLVLWAESMMVSLDLLGSSL